MDIMKVGSIKKDNYNMDIPLANDLLITVRTRVNNEEPYFLLYQCSDSKVNGISSVAQIKITQQLPETIDDINPIFVSPDISTNCKEAILQWSKESDNWGINNWESLKDKYNTVNCENRFNPKI